MGFGKKKLIVPFILAAFLTAAPAWGLSDIQFLFKSDQELVGLDAPLKTDVIDRLTEIATSCEYPQASNKEWKEKLFSPYGFHIIYKRPVDMSFPTFANGYQTTSVREVTEIMLPLDTDPPGSGIYVRTADEKWTFLFKCDGEKMIDLICKPELQEYYPDGGVAYEFACSNRTPPEDEQKDAGLGKEGSLPPDETQTDPASGEANADDWSELAPPPQNADDIEWEDPHKTTAVEIQNGELIIQ